MGVRVLLVDDEQELRALWREVLANAGHRVHEAGSVAEVRAWATDGQADVAIVDWTLPDGTGGDVRDLLRAAGLTCPVLFASGYGASLPRGHGGDAILAKPFRVRDLLQAVDRLTGSGG